MPDIDQKVAEAKAKYEAKAKTAEPEATNGLMGRLETRWIKATEPFQKITATIDRSPKWLSSAGAAFCSWYLWWLLATTARVNGAPWWVPLAVVPVLLAAPAAGLGVKGVGKGAKTAEGILGSKSLKLALAVVVGLFLYAKATSAEAPTSGTTKIEPTQPPAGSIARDLVEDVISTDIALLCSHLDGTSNKLRVQARDQLRKLERTC
jgi:hypothetical protein